MSNLENEHYNKELEMSIMVWPGGVLQPRNIMLALIRLAILFYAYGHGR